MVEDFWGHTNEILGKYGFFPMDLGNQTVFKVDKNADGTLKVTTYHLWILGDYFIVKFGSGYAFHEPERTTMYDALGKYAFLTFDPEGGAIMIADYDKHIVNLISDELNEYRKCLEELIEYWKTIKVVDVPQIGEV